MVYYQNFVVSILYKGNVLREIDGKVYLPFNSDYQIRLKNLDSKLRCKAKVKVDGSYIHPEDISFVLQPNDTFDIKRLLIDGNMKRGSKLRFVSVNDSRANDPSNVENGIIEVSFYKEIDETFFHYLGLDDSSNGNPLVYYWKRNDSSNGNPLDYCPINCCLTNNLQSNGTTIAGEDVNQEFYTTNDFPTTIIPAKIRLTMIGRESSLTVKETRKKYCTKCGKKNPFKAKFCMNCGNRF